MDFSKYGLTPEQIQQLTTEYNAEIEKIKADAIKPYENYDSLKSDLDNKNTVLSTTEKDLKQSQKLVDKLNEELNKSLLDRAIDKAFFNKDVKDSDLFATQIDRTKITKNENGEFIGLNEQIEGVLTKYAHLLKKANNPLHGKSPAPTPPEPKPLSPEEFLGQGDFSMEKWQKYLNLNR